MSGPNARFAVGRGKALAFQRDVALFSAISEASEEAYDDLKACIPAGTEARMFRPALEPLPPGWEHVVDYPLLQMLAPQRLPAPALRQGASVVQLTDADLPDIQALVELTKPGPFGLRALDLGHYYGVRMEGQLVAMAGERLRVPGYVEICSICASPAARGQGLATLLIEEMMRRARERQEVAFLHVVAANQAAIALYQRLGFATRRQLRVVRRRPLR